MPGFDEAYPALREWVTSHGWIEVGLIEGFSSMIQVLNAVGLIWKLVMTGGLQRAVMSVQPSLGKS